MLPASDALRKMAFNASHGNYRGAWGCVSPSPALDPSEDDSKRAVIAFNTQRPHRPLTAADVADEPGYDAIQCTQRQVEHEAAALHDLKAPGTLPQDNRLLKMLIRHGAAKPITTWINSVLRGVAHAIAAALLAGAIRAALLAKLHAVTGEVKGRRPLGICEKWACLVWAIVNACARTGINRLLTRPLPEDMRAHEQRVASAEARVTAVTIERDAAVGAGSAAAATAHAAVAAAEAALAAARRPFKFVANFCYDSKPSCPCAHAPPS
jgi:hypothetical protein